MKSVLGMRVQEVPDGDSWRVLYLGKLLEARGEANYLGDDVRELTALIDSLCCT